jgi:hypothetical protein
MLSLLVENALLACMVCDGVKEVVVSTDDCGHNHNHLYTPCPSIYIYSAGVCCVIIAGGKEFFFFFFLMYCVSTMESYGENFVNFV